MSPLPVSDIWFDTPELQMGGVFIVTQQEVFGYAMFIVSIYNAFHMLFDSHL